MEIQYIKGEIEAIERDPEHPGLIIVKIPLNQAPDSDWIECFIDNPLRWVSVHKPAVEGDSILLRANEEKVEENVKYVLGCIKEANECYQKILEERRSREMETKEREIKEKETIEQITKRLRNL